MDGSCKKRQLDQSEGCLCAASQLFVECDRAYWSEKSVSEKDGAVVSYSMLIWEQKSGSHYRLATTLRGGMMRDMHKRRKGGSFNKIMLEGKEVIDHSCGITRFIFCVCSNRNFTAKRCSCFSPAQFWFFYSGLRHSHAVFLLIIAVHWSPLDIHSLYSFYTGWSLSAFPLCILYVWFC